MKQFQPGLKIWKAKMSEFFLFKRYCRLNVAISAKIDLFCLFGGKDDGVEAELSRFEP